MFENDVFDLDVMGMICQYQRNPISLSGPCLGQGVRPRDGVNLTSSRSHNGVRVAPLMEEVGHEGGLLLEVSLV